VPLCQCARAGVMMGIDLCYNLHSAYGNWFPGVKTLIIQVRAWLCSEYT
jgi:hypothetical protein